MKIIYIGNTRIPTELAHGYQISKMCEMFGRNGVDLSLVLPELVNNIAFDLFSYYAIQKSFKVQYLRIFHNINITNKIKNFSFNLFSLFYLYKLFFLKIDKNILIYTRAQEIAGLFKLKGYKVVYECHNWLEKKNFLLKNINLIITTNLYIRKRL